MNEAWESVAYTEWPPETLIEESGNYTFNIPHIVKLKRWRWLPGPDVISNDEYESWLEERNRRVKGGQ